MDLTGLRVLNAVTSSPALLLRCRTRQLPLLPRQIFSCQCKSGSFHANLSISSPTFNPLRSQCTSISPSRKCQAHATILSNGFCVAAAGETSPTGEFLQVVLVSPQIPGNTGCIARTCAASSVKLHLVEPLGFQIDAAKVKRAGLDYWPYVVVKVHSSWSEFREYFKKQDGDKRLLAFTKRGSYVHSDFTYRRGDWLVFGSETCGLPPEALLDCTTESMGGGTVRIPMVETYVRCLNLSVSVGIALYEASRQLNYEQLQNSTEPCTNGAKQFLTEDIFA